jgi:VWFA-related protein
MSKSFRTCITLLLGVSVLALAQRSQFLLPKKTDSSATAASLTRANGRIALDVVVTNKSGRPVIGLERQDFTLLDNSEPAKIHSFQAFNSTTAKPVPPVEVILVINLSTMSGQQADAAKYEVEKFLRANDGHLAQPVLIFLISDAGISSTHEPSTDGNALADEIARGKELSGSRHDPMFYAGQTDPRSGVMVTSFGRTKITLLDAANLNSMQYLGSIALEQRRKPGRKLLFWLGTGWRGLCNSCFDWITEFSTRLREARITLFNVWPNLDHPVDGVAGTRSLWGSPLGYADYQPVKSEHEARGQSLVIPVLAAQSGGGTLNGVDGVAAQIEKYAAQASAFYNLEFEPAITNQVDEYHDLKVEVGNTDLIIHTSAEYYDEPSYRDRPSEASHVTVEELEQMLGSARSDKELAKTLYGVELTERMSSRRLLSWETRLPGKRSRVALVGLADQSAFLAPPAADVPAPVVPDTATQRLMVSRAVEYLSKIVPKLPNFFAARTTIRYEEPSQKEATWKTVASDRSLHETGHNKTTVSFRDGKEADGNGFFLLMPDVQERDLHTQGTFGPILSMVFANAAAAHSEFTWSNWQQAADGPQAVFRYTVPQEASDFDVEFCCLADTNGTIALKRKPAYHGEVTIDPASGTILRLTVQADLNPALATGISDIMVEYGPVMIGGNSYICPVRSVSLTRQRTAHLVNEWGESFGVYGRFETILNDVTCGDYHLFRSQSRIITDDGHAPKDK